jgi:cell division protein FtsQ
MSDISMTGFDESNFSASTYNNNADRKTKAVKIIFLVLCALLLLEVVVYKIIMPSMRMPEIKFRGAKTYTAAELSEIISPLNGTNWFTFDTRKAEDMLASSAAIDYAHVVKHFPDHILITIEERVPVALTFLNENGRSLPVDIDKNGVLFPQRTAGNDADIIPIISGLPVEHMTEGMRIPVKYRTLIDQITQIRALPQKYFAAISEICVVPKEFGNYELVLIPSNSRTRVLTDRALNEDALQYMMVVLDVVNSIEPNVSEIDLRYGSVSYRTR